MSMHRCFAALGCLILCLVLLPGISCAPNGKQPANPSLATDALQAVQFNDPLSMKPAPGPVKLRGARNEVVSFAVQVNRIAPTTDSRRPSAVRLTPMAKGASIIPAGNYSAYQVLLMPVDTNRAGFVRHTGAAVTTRRLPRALLPIPHAGGTLFLASLRDPDSLPTTPRPAAPGSAAPVIWVDLQIPPTIEPGDYEARCELVEDGQAVAQLPISLSIDDFLIPDERHLTMVGRLSMATLARHHAVFAGVEPHLLSRRDPQFRAAVKVLDDLVKLGQAHRVSVVVPDLRPAVKWPFGKPPQVDWADFDSVVAPWLTGNAFPDLVPLGHWPLPEADRLYNYATTKRLEYWSAAAEHFEQQEWLNRSAIDVHPRSEGRATLEDSLEISRYAAQLLAAHPRVRVSLPLEEELVQQATPENPRLIPSGNLDRVLYAAAGLVSSSGAKLPENAGTRFVRTDLPGLIPYVGAGADEREVRLIAWLAFLRNARLVQWDGVLPLETSPQQEALVDQLVWFYPGSWFGVDAPVPSLHLKWLRRAEQDYEYLYLARQRTQHPRALVLARLLTKPVEVRVGQRPDASEALLSGTADPEAWNQALVLLARTIRLSAPGQAPNEAVERRLAIDLSNWSELHETPVLLGRAIEYDVADQGRIVALRLGVDIYNAADRQPENNQLQWGPAPAGWMAPQAPVKVPRLGVYHVDRFFLSAQVDADRVTPESRQPVKVTFVDGYTGKLHSLQVAAPISWSEYRNGPAPRVDGSLGDWMREDALHDGKLIEMLSRPAVQKQQLRYGTSPSAVYSTWTQSGLYLGFHVEGVDGPAQGFGRNFTDREFRRAWGEDVVEVLAQPIYEDNSVGPLLHLACKPQGQIEIARRLNPKLNATPWQAFTGADILYGATVQANVWRGELAIPWEAVNDAGHRGQRPVALRFNFAQHRGATGMSYTWAGPVDHGRDEQLMGLLSIRVPR